MHGHPGCLGKAAWAPWMQHGPWMMLREMESDVPKALEWLCNELDRRICLSPWAQLEGMILWAQLEGMILLKEAF